MVFQCFLDDSKDQDQSKVFVSAGFLGTIEYWSDLRAAWSKCLKQFGLEYFKTSEFKMLRGQFEVLKSAAYPSPKGREKANEIRDSLLAIPRNLSGIKGVGCVIPVEDYAKVCARPEAKEFLKLNRTGEPLKEFLTKSAVALKAYLASTQSRSFMMKAKISTNCGATTMTTRC